MKLMHTSLPEFKLKMKSAVATQSPNKILEIKGIENLKSAKMQSLRTGRIEYAVEEVASGKGVNKIEMVVMPRIPETMHTIVIKGYDREGKPTKAILETLNIIHPTEEIELENFKEEQITDKRPSLGEH